MKHYSKQKRMLVAVDSIIFGFDGHELKLLLIQRGFEPEKGKWSLMGGFVGPEEDFEQAGNRILKQLTGLNTERIDTRVLQVIYAVKPTDVPLFVGQQVDVYIDADRPPSAGVAMMAASSDAATR